MLIIQNHNDAFIPSAKSLVIVEKVCKQEPLFCRIPRQRRIQPAPKTQFINDQIELPPFVKIEEISDSENLGDV